MATAKRKPTKPTFMEELEIRIKRNDRPPDAAPIRERATQRHADLAAGYPKVGTRFGTVDPGNPDIRESGRARITRNAVTGADAGWYPDYVMNALDPSGERRRLLPHEELTVPRAKRRK